MYTVQISDEISKQIEDKVDDIINSIREKSRKLLNTCNTYDEATSKLGEYITSCCDAESRSISSSLYFDLYSQFSQSRLFSNPELVNEFYALDMRNYLNENCRFNLNDNFSYSSKDRQKYSISIGVGIAIIGSAISIALSLPLGTIPSVLVGAIAYPVTFKTVQNRNIEKYLVDVELYLKRLKSTFMTWVNSFEDCYSETINDLMCKVGLINI
ncbi:MAG: hypothetical protein LIO71_00370 [Ruminococcus sp.]|nr:hypothetical protein [Ruminococcus sp.]MCD7800825.1 hypothetical protein [Ruminococcus sp.]